ncbi:MAG TPA: hypothetical protein VKT70_09500 [Stellaceae bacterium]|nr:hypothetical protein [Stellaceae bacterium]
MKIMIGSPSYDGSVRREYMASVIALIEALRARGIEYALNIKAQTLVHVARNLICADFLADRAATHLLFIDVDIGFSPSAIMKLLERSVPVTACACPYRELPLNQVLDGVGQNLGDILSRLYKYNFDPVLEGGKLTIKEGFIGVRSIGTALMLITRDALERMIAGGHAQKYTASEFPPHYYGFFDYIFENGREIGEDKSFCARWLKCSGGPIPCLVSEYLSHVGPVDMRGRFWDKAVAQPPAAT